MVVRMALLLSFFLVGACSSFSGDPAEQIEKPVEVLYNEAADSLDNGDYFAASRLFEEVERQHPYSKWSTQAQLMAGYSYYKDQKYDEAILSLERFIELHPGNDNIDYAYYLRAISLYEQISDVRRDQEMTKEALLALQTVTRRFPNSDYARDARLKADLALDHLAGKEMEVGRYYLERGHLNAALKRFQIVVKEFQTTSHTPEALHRLVEGYLTLGLVDEATRVAAVLGHNYPGSRWYERSYALLDPQERQKLDDDRGVLGKTIESLFSRNDE